MSRLLPLVLSLCAATAWARMAYQLPAGAESILRARAFSQNFNCEGRRYGYYADTANDCQLFHVCFPVEDDAGQVVETAHFSFFCGNETVFDQATLSCNDQVASLPCAQAEAMYDVANADFGLVLKK